MAKTTQDKPLEAPEKPAEAETVGEVLLALSRAADGRLRVTVVTKEGGASAVKKTQGWLRKGDALAELARAIPQLQRFLAGRPSARASVPDAEAQQAEVQS